MNKKLIFIPCILCWLWCCTSQENARCRNYSYVADRKVESNHFEMTKLIGGSHINANGYLQEVLYLNYNKSIVVVTSAHNLDGSTCQYWKIGESGHIIDNYSGKLSMSEVGVFFADDYYVDWPLTGNKSRKKYQSIISVDDRPLVELKKVLRTAESVAFDKDWDKRSVRCYLNSGKGWQILETQKYFDQFDCNYDKERYELDLKGFPKNNTSRVVLLETTPVNYDWANPQNPLHVQAFDKEGSRSRSFFDFNPNGPAWAGKYGKGYFQLNHKGESLNFKAFAATRYGSGEYDPYIELFHLPDEKNNRLSLRLLHFRRHPSGERPAAELGIYVVRPKNRSTPEAIAALEREGIDMGQWHVFQKKYTWHPKLTGFSPLKGTLRRIRYFSGDDENLASSFANLPPASPRKVPKEMVLYWERRKRHDNNQENSLLLYFNREIFEFENAYGLLWVFYFDENETFTAFKALEEEASVEIVFTLRDFPNDRAILSLALSDGKRTIPLNKAHLTATGRSYHFDKTKEIRQFEMLMKK